jgi:type IV pilus assembly protein PilE
MKLKYRQMSGQRRVAGVTLIELVVVMAIVGILTAIAYPSYQRYVAKTHRKTATACLSQYANFMERYYTTNLNYENADPDMGCSTENDMARYYSFPEPEIGDDFRTYTISAVPTAAQQALDPDHCGTLTLDQASGRDPANNACW